MTRDPRMRSPYLLLVGLGGVAASVVLAACSGGSGSTAGSVTPTPSDSAAARAGSGFGGGAAPGTSGLIAEIDGNTLQVQSTDGQTAVTLTATTTYTDSVRTSLKAVSVGSCIVATAPAATTGTASAPATPAARPDAITATTITVSPAVNGTCTGGFGGRGGTRPTGAPTGTRPTGFPTGARGTGAAGARGGFGSFVTGQVTAVSASTLTVKETARGAASSSGTAPTTATVTVTGTTTITTTAAATRAAVKVGECATAIGKADSTGAVTATRVALSTATNGQCTTGFGGGFGRRGGGFPGAGTPTNG